jgi:aspartate carbamoyltransferase catalytic subunit
VTQHLLSIDDLGADGIVALLDLAEHMAEVSAAYPQGARAAGETVVSLFFEDSTRTGVSFETAARRLSADVVRVQRRHAQRQEGESLQDTIETIAAMGIDAVVRHGSSGARGR